MQLTLKRKSKLVRWAYFNEVHLNDAEYRIPKQTSVCALFWRSFVWMPLYAFGAGVILVVISPILFIVWLSTQYRKLHPKKQKVYPTREDRFWNWVEDSLLVRGVVAMKQKVCPIVILED